MCECLTKVSFEIDNGNVFDVESLEENNCSAFYECIDCAVLDDKLINGTYTADLFCKVYPTRNWEGIEFNTENGFANIREKQNEI